MHLHRLHCTPRCIGLPECYIVDCSSVFVCVFAEFAHPHTGPGGPRASIHPQLVSERELAVLMSKAHLILRSIQLKIGHDLLMQVSDYVIIALMLAQSIPPTCRLPSFSSSPPFLRFFLSPSHSFILLLSFSHSFLSPSHSFILLLSFSHSFLSPSHSFILLLSFSHSFPPSPPPPPPPPPLSLSSYFFSPSFAFPYLSPSFLSTCPSTLSLSL